MSFWEHFKRANFTSRKHSNRNEIATKGQLISISSVTTLPDLKNINFWFVRRLVCFHKIMQSQHKLENKIKIVRLYSIHESYGETRRNTKNSLPECVQRPVLRWKLTEIKSSKATITRETSIILEDTFLCYKVCLSVTNRVKEYVDTVDGRFDSKRWNSERTDFYDKTMMLVSIFFHL